MFCVTDAQRNGVYLGQYTDDDVALWDWEWKKPDDPAVDDNKVDGEEKDGSVALKAASIAAVLAIIGTQMWAAL